MLYKIEWFVNDLGTQVRRLILELPEPASIAEVQKDCFNVYVERRDENGELMLVKNLWTDPAPTWTRGYRTILAAYPSDDAGNPRLQGDYITLELDMSDPQSRAIIGSIDASKFVDCRYRVTQIAPIGQQTGMVWDKCGEILCPQVRDWQHGRCESANLNYAWFTPATEGERPLIIWLHGAGEGGMDPRTAYMGNNVVALSSEKVQGYFGGAYVLTPQCPTMWMDDGTHTYGHTGKSMYTSDLKALIDEFAAAHPIDRSRIYVGGCSNGGFMSMRLMIDYPGYFAAGYPMCEALYNDTISDEQIAVLSETPIWLLHAATDAIVSPEETAVPTYKRLMAAGAQNIHMTYIDDRPPMPMINHGVWVPGLRDEFNVDFDGQPVLADGKAVTRFQWLAKQKLS